MAFQRVQTSSAKSSQSLQNDSGFVPQRSLIETQQTSELHPSKAKQESKFTFDFTQIPVHGFYPTAAIQPKLTIGQLGDKYETEADIIAHQVVQRMHEPQGNIVQREEMPEEDEEKLRMKPIEQPLSDVGGMSATPDLEASIQQVRGSGQALSDQIRKPMERSFGFDFSGVKIHTNAHSDQLNQSIQAKAFTTGKDIFFRQGAYNPGSRGGQELIAHELTHVVQQGNALRETNPQKMNQASDKLQNKQQSNFIQRLLDEDFDHAGTPKAGETEKCKAFAQQVSNYVDQAYNEIISGQLDAWKGAKAATFIEMVMRGSSVAHTHAANAIEERVYALMSKPMLGLEWTPQFTEGMGGASKPDIVIHLPNKANVEREALVDITSDRAHILGKAGGWTTSTRYIYVAEAYFPPITKKDIPNIKAALEKGGIGLDEAQKLKQEADRQRLEQLLKKQAETKKVRDDFNSYGNFTSFAQNSPIFSSLPQKTRATAASKFLRQHGISVKGMRRIKGKRKMSDESKKKLIEKAKKEKAVKQKRDVATLLKVIQGTTEIVTTETVNDEELLDAEEILDDEELQDDEGILDDEEFQDDEEILDDE